jgi:anhydro-N-acetylmuramic acid kinase
LLLSERTIVRVIGLISGTSVDGIDAALVEITGTQTDLRVQLVAGEIYPYPPALRSQILAVCAGEALSMPAFSDLDDAIASEFARAALAIQALGTPAELIGSHGQTVYHHPPALPKQLGYSLQLGRGATIAHLTQLPTVSNFRAADIAAGGQGAPLVSRIDACLLSHPTFDRCVQNIGGIGNLTYLPATSPATTSNSAFSAGICGWDTGPGNVLIDLAVQHLTQGAQRFDRDGAWAATGAPSAILVERWLQQAYFHQPPPKSTGRELFGPAFLQDCLADAAAEELDAADILATLTEFTAASIALSYQSLPAFPHQVLLCGGGSRNHYLRQCLQRQLGATQVLTTDDVGLNSDFKEAIAFAILAYWRVHDLPGNLPAVTGANRAIPLGEVNG